ncbi:MAG TPA: hypothetical protein VJ165_02400 [candidate division Zixibacteria bacterium]|nr:hypothetical protein [candidate division Zixibacteria bacterium]
MPNLFGKPTRAIGYLALAVLLLLSVFWFACSDTRHNTTGPQVGEISGKLASPSQLVSVMAIQDKHTPELMSIKGVVGTATGLDANGTPAIKVYTENKMVTGIPKQLNGVAVDVEVKGKAFALALTGRYRPVPNGVSVGNNLECAAGTIGCVVEQGTSHYILSNNHVLARINAASIGESIVQPGRYDNKPKCANHGTADQVATLSDFVVIKFDGSDNKVDGAIAQLTTSFTCATLAGFYGLPSNTPVAPSLGLAIKKVGRTSSLTTGTITAVNATINVNYGGGQIARFVNQIITTKRVSKSGDSGSLVVTNDANDNPVGLLFAGFSDGSAILNVITDVLSAFGNPNICDHAH